MRRSLKLNLSFIRGYAQPESDVLPTIAQVSDFALSSFIFISQPLPFYYYDSTLLLFISVSKMLSGVQLSGTLTLAADGHLHS